MRREGAGREKSAAATPKHVHFAWDTGEAGMNPCTSLFVEAA